MGLSEHREAKRKAAEIEIKEKALKKSELKGRDDPALSGTTPFSRDDWIRTSDPFVPNEVRYRAALQPEITTLQIKKIKDPLEIKSLLRSRVDWIRTSDPLHPMQVRYRAAPPPEHGKIHLINLASGIGPKKSFGGGQMYGRIPQL